MAQKAIVGTILTDYLVEEEDWNHKQTHNHHHDDNAGTQVDALTVVVVLSFSVRLRSGRLNVVSQTSVIYRHRNEHQTLDAKMR